MATIEIVNTPPTPPTGATRPIDLNALKALLPDRAILIQMSGVDLDDRSRVALAAMLSYPMVAPEPP